MLKALNTSDARVPLDRLADAPPYFAIDTQGLVLFLCRWSTAAPIPVALLDGASSSEREVVRTALRAWEDAGLGVEFREVSAAEALMRIQFAPERVPPDHSGSTIADCATSQEIEHTSSAGPVPADLAYASIVLHRTRYDALGRIVALERDELLGAALHELGHALGYPGHAARGDSVMVKDLDAVRRAGARVLSGAKLEAPSLRALYVLPSGTVVGRLRIEASVLSGLRELAATAQKMGWRGPYVRVGDTDARLFWRVPGQGRAVFNVRNWREVLRKPDRLADSGTLSIPGVSSGPALP